MPVMRPNGEMAFVKLYDVIGKDSESEKYFVRHLGFADEQKDNVKKGVEIRAKHMNPPFKQSSIQIDVIGSAGLSADMVQNIKIFLDERESEYNAHLKRRDWLKQYIACPHKKDVLGRDGTIIYSRYSCAGFVVEGYEEAKIELINIENLPLVTESLLGKVFEELSRLNSDQRNELGIVGNGPWPVLLPGYVMHSLNRPVEEIQDGPYQPKHGDEKFE
jgi:hypothetical protein